MARPRRIMIIGGPGAGKSTLARRLGGLTGLPVTHLDRLCLQPGWEAVPDTVMMVRAVQAAAGPAWILDGNYPQSWHVRARRSDLIVFLDLPRHVRLRRLVWRLLTYYGRSRPDLGPGLPERFDPEFWRIARAYDRQGRPEALALIRECEREGAPRCVILRSTRAVDWFIREMARSGSVGPTR